MHGVIVSACAAKNTLRIVNTITFIWRENVLGLKSVLGYCNYSSSKLTVSMELHSWKTVPFSGKVMSANKYRSIFSHEMVATVYLERCLIESHKTKTLANHKRHRQYSEPIKTQRLLHAADAKRRKTRVCRVWFWFYF